MSQTPSQLPVNWTEYHAKVAPRREIIEESIQEMIVEIEEAIEANWLGPSFQFYGFSLTTLSLIFGPETYIKHFDEAMDLLKIHLESFEQRTEKDVWYKITDVIAFLAIARSMGVSTIPSIAEGFEEKWLPLLKKYKRQMSDDEPQTMALTALATAQFDLVPFYSGCGPLRAKIEPGRTFQFNVTEFIRYMASAAKKGMEAEAVKPAFHEFVSLFIMKLQANSLRDVDLILAAQAYYVHFEKCSPGEIIQRLYELINEIKAIQSPKITFVSIAELLTISPELTITYQTGSENSPYDKHGRIVLTIKGDGETILESYKAGRDPKQRDATIASYQIIELVDSLKEGDFPNGSQQIFVPGATIATIRVEQAGAKAELKLDRYEAQKMTGYSRAYDILDSLAAQLAPYGD